MVKFDLSFSEIIKKKINSLFFIIYFFFTEDRIIKKFKEEKNLDKYYLPKYKKLINNPVLVYFRSFAKLHNGQIENGFKDLEDFEQIKTKYERKSFQDVLKNQVLPPCRITGSFGNYRTVFSYLYNRINIQNINFKPKLYIKEFDKITNSYLFNFFEPFVNLKKNSFLFYKNFNKTYYNKSPIEITSPYKNKYYPWAITENLINQHRLKNKKLKFDFFKLKQKHYDEGMNVLKKYNLSKYKWYVALQLRESKDADDQSFRNVNINNYLKSIEEIISRGGLVFRVGGTNSTKLPKIEGLIDYPFSKFKSNFMDIFLAATSKFIIGTSSGFWTAASFFNTPLLMTNYLPFIDYFSFNKQSIFLPKTVIDEKKKIISIKDSYSISKMGWAHRTSHFSLHKKKIIENSEEEILTSVKEMLDLTSKQENNKFLYLNDKFKNNFFANEFYSNQKLKPLSNFSSSYINKYI